MRRKTRCKLWRVTALCLFISSLIGLLVSILGVGVIAINHDSDPSTSGLRCLLLGGNAYIANPLNSFTAEIDDDLVYICYEYSEYSDANRQNKKKIIVQYPKTDPGWWNPSERYFAGFLGIDTGNKRNSNSLGNRLLDAFLLTSLFDNGSAGSSKLEFIVFDNGELISVRIPTGIPFFLSTTITVLIFRRTRRYPSGHCEECNYNLTNNTTGTCPECGNRATTNTSPSVMP